MSSQTHKKTLKQLEKTEFLVASARTWKPTVNARRAGAGGSPGARSGTPGEPDWDHVQEWCIAELETSAESLRRADRLPGPAYLGAFGSLAHLPGVCPRSRWPR